MATTGLQHAGSDRPHGVNRRLEMALITILATPVVVGVTALAAVRMVIQITGREGRVVEHGPLDQVLSWIAPSGMAMALIGIPCIVLATVIGGVVLIRSARHSREWRVVAAALTVGWLATVALISSLVAATLAHNAR